MIRKTNIICEELVASSAEAEVPMTIERPIFDCDIVPVILAPGWLEGQVAFDGLRHHLAALGRPTITMEHPPTFSGTMFSSGLQRAKNLHAVIKKAREHYGYELFDVVGHSAGGEDIIELAKHEGELIRRLTLMASAGLIEGDTVAAIIKRLPGAHMHEMNNIFKHPKNEARIVLDGLSRFGHNPLKAVLDGLHAGNIDIRDQVIKVTDDIPVDCVQFAQDLLFEVEPVNQSTVDIPFGSNTVHELEYAGHNAHALYPRQVAEHLDVILGTNQVADKIAS